MDNKNSTVISKTREKAADYIGAAFGFVAGLAWNEAITSLIEYILPFNKGSGGIVAQFAYAVLMTIILVVVITIATRRIKPSLEE